MKIFNVTQDFIALVNRDAIVEEMKPLSQLLRDTREHHLLFGSEIGEYLEELYKKGVRLHTIHQKSGPQRILQPADIPVQIEIVEWFSAQHRAADQKFLKYIDFREP